MRIGYFTDIHLRQAVPGTSEIARRRCRQMPEALRNCLEQLEAGGMDLIVCSGDCVDEPDHPEAATDLAAIHDMIEAASIPSIIIPGNHDPQPEKLYRIFKKPQRSIVLDDCRFIIFFDDVCVDGELDSCRGKEAFADMRKLLSENPPEVKHTILIQHYLIYPDLNETYPYNYQNAAEIVAVMESSPACLFSISGHYHHGFAPTIHNGVTYFCGRAICESPFGYYILDTGGDTIGVKEFSVENAG